MVWHRITHLVLSSTARASTLFVGIVEINRVSESPLIAYALDQPLHRCTKFRILTDKALNLFHRVNNCRVMLPAELSCDVRVAGLRKALAKIHCDLPWKQDMASV